MSFTLLDLSVDQSFPKSHIHLLQYVDPDHIYHTLDSNSGNGGGEALESVGVIDVKLPNGRTVAATLVREDIQHCCDFTKSLCDR